MLNSRLADVAGRCRSALRQPATDAGLLTGHAGLVLFLLYYARRTGAESDRHAADAAIGELFDTLPADAPFTFCSGMAGIAWLLRHAVAEGLLEADADEALADVDAQLRDYMVAEMEAGRFDYLHGSLGVALYLLEAGHAPDNHRALSATLDALERHAHDGDEQSWWINPFNVEHDGVGAISLGLSHGIPSIAVVMQRFVEEGVERERASRLRDRASQYLLAQRLDPDAASRFPAFAGEGPSRLAWCYGDPGVGMALARAGAGADAIDALTHAAMRGTAGQDGPTDLSLCHGSAGLALIFNHARRLTSDAVFASASRQWLNDTLERLDSTEDVSMLTGVAGAGLAMIALANPDDSRASAWDRALLLR